MATELFEHFTYVVWENAELTTKLQLAEAEISNLKSANKRLENGLLTLSEKLEDANNEIGRLGMVLKHRAKEVSSERWPDKRNDWPRMVARHH